MRTVPERVFSRAEARASGWSDAALARAVRSGRLVRLRRGQYTAPERGADPSSAARAAVRSCRGAVASHSSAALLHGLPLLDAVPHRPCVTVAPCRTGDATGAHLHRATLPSDDCMLVDGVPVTSVARTLVDLGRSLSMPAAVVAMDAALHRSMVDVDELYRVAVRCWNWPGIRRAHRALDRVDARAESPLESVSRLVLAWLGLPAPRSQVTLHDSRGTFLGRPDFYWDDAGVAGEADGRSKYDDRSVLIAEKLRQEAMEDAGVVVVRWGWTDIVRTPHMVRDRISRALERGQQRERSGSPRLWTVSRS